MKTLISALVAASFLAPCAVLAAEIGGPVNGTVAVVVRSWDAGKRLLTIKSGNQVPYSMMGCTVPAAIGVPGSIAKGRPVYLQYTGPGPGLAGGPSNDANVCQQIELK